MRKLHLAAISTISIFALMSVQTPLWATVDSGPADETDAYVRQAFTLDEMNCFSSDIRARETTLDTDPRNILDLRIASSQGGTNGIPCKARDPKAPPKKKRSRS